MKMKITVDIASHLEFVNSIKQYCEYVVKRKNKSIKSKNVFIEFTADLYTFSYNNQLERIEVLDNRTNTFECLYIRDNIVFTTIDCILKLRVIFEQNNNFKLCNMDNPVQFEKYALKIFCDKMTNIMVNRYPTFYTLKTELELVFHNNVSQSYLFNLSSLKQFIYGMLANGKTVHDICYSIACDRGNALSSVRHYEMLYPETLLEQIFSIKIPYNNVLLIAYYYYLYCNENPISEQEKSHYKYIDESIDKIHEQFKLGKMKSVTILYDTNKLKETIKKITVQQVSLRMANEQNFADRILPVKQYFDNINNDVFSFTIKADCDCLVEYSTYKWHQECLGRLGFGVYGFNIFQNLSDIKGFYYRRKNVLSK